VVEAMEATASAPGLNRMIINVGSGKETSVTELIRKVMDMTGRKPEIVMNQTHDSGPSRMRADLALAKKKLGYVPKMSLEDGINRILELDARFKK
jgi:nucleoside-diphosphate-sugar epimerase